MPYAFRDDTGIVGVVNNYNEAKLIRRITGIEFEGVQETRTHWLVERHVVVYEHGSITHSSHQYFNNDLRLVKLAPGIMVAYGPCFNSANDLIAKELSKS